MRGKMSFKLIGGSCIITIQRECNGDERPGIGSAVDRMVYLLAVFVSSGENLKIPGVILA